MKKKLVILLAIVFVISSVTCVLAACNSTVVEIRIENAPNEVTRGDVIDYSEINVVATLEGGGEKTLPITDKSVNYDPIDMETVGFKTLSVRYGGMSAQVVIQVVEMPVDYEHATFLSYAQAEGYAAYQEAIKEQDNKQREFYNRDTRYQVGIDNGYWLVPSVSIYTLGPRGDKYYVVQATDFKTTYKIYRLESGNFVEIPKANESNYLANVENNVYYFKESALHDVFKIEVTLATDQGYEFNDPTMKTTIEQEFEVVDGYNVYNALGMSVLDNLNINSWKDIKKQKLPWDNGKALSEFADVSRVILHNNITITTEYLPDNYFWVNEKEAAVGRGVSYRDAYNAIAAEHPLKKYFKGSIKETALGEAWEGDSTGIQRGLYVSDGIGLSGNYLTIHYDPNYNTDGNKGLYIVYDYNKKGATEYHEAHWSIIRYQQASESDHSATIENVYFVGATGKTENIALPTALMMMSGNLTTTSISNSIAADWFANAVVDAEDYGTLNVTDCKWYNSFSAMVFSRRMAEINVTHSEMKAAGGPLFVIHTRTGDGDDDVTNTTLNIDSTQNLESWLGGGEIWFEINDLQAEIIMQLTAVASRSDTVAGTHYRRATSDEDFQVNLIAVVIPNPSKVFTNQHAIKGEINIGNCSYTMEDTAFNAIMSVNSVASSGATAAADTLKALEQAKEGGLMSEDDYNKFAGQVEALRDGFAKLVLMPIAPIYKSGNNYGFFDGSKLKTISELQTLYGGAQYAQQTLTAFGATDVANEWNDVLNNEYLKALTQVSPSTGNWTDGHLVCLINPGGIDANNPDFKLKHFMILLGEDTATSQPNA